MVNLQSKRPLIISGPCSAESRAQTLETCRLLAATGRVDVLRAGVWKPRTRPGQFEGRGARGLAWLCEAGRLNGLPVTTEVATARHVEAALSCGVGMVWIGARTTVNPFSVQEIADALKGCDIPVLIKNPMHPDIDLWSGAVDRILGAGISPHNIGLIHRGFSGFGASKYRNTPMWHLALEMRSRRPEFMMLCDPSHICGRRDLLKEVAQKAADLCYDGLMMESHIDPDCALSDAAQQLTPADLDRMLGSLHWRKDSSGDPEYTAALDRLRIQIDHIDEDIFGLLSRRMNLAGEIGEIKRVSEVAILQGRRWSEIVERVVAQSHKLGLSEEFLRTVLEAIHLESINRQNEVMNR